MKDAMALVFAYQRSEQMNVLTSKRSLPSIPFGGRYRIVDFALSNIVNSGITKVGLITLNNYQSLLDHIGSGKEWDLNRKREGLFVLPPFSNQDDKQPGELYRGKMEALLNAEAFIRRSDYPYCVLSTANAVCNMTFDDALAFHKAKNADITIIYKCGKFDMTEKHTDSNCFLFTDENGRVTDVSIDPIIGREKLSTGQMIINKPLLESLIWECKANDQYSLYRDVLQKKLGELKIYGYEYTGYWEQISNVTNYFQANLDLLNTETRLALFYQNNKIFTKVRDDVPTAYLNGSVVKNSLIADGCIIEGYVENCILSRSVRVRKGAVLKNCVVMQSGEIQKNAYLENCILDKEVVVREDRKLVGHERYPMVLAKGSVL